MKKSVLMLAMFLVALSATAQQKALTTFGNGTLKKESREPGSFTKLNTKGPFQIRLVPGAEPKITIEAESNLLELIVTEVKNGELIIAPAEGKLFKASGGNKIIIKVPADALTAITYKGSGTVTSRKPLRNDMNITLDGAGSATLEMASGNTTAFLLGTGMLTLGGKTGNFKCVVKGDGLVVAEDMECNRAEIDVQGTGSAKVYSISSIKGRINGSGNIAFGGNPKDRDLKKEGTGEFRAL